MFARALEERDGDLKVEHSQPKKKIKLVQGLYTSKSSSIGFKLFGGYFVTYKDRGDVII